MPYVRVVFTLLALCGALPAGAQSYPTKTVRLVSPFPPGGSVDVVGRILAAKLSGNFGQQVIVDNRSGASGIIGTELVAKAPPEEFAMRLAGELKKWGDVIKKRGLKPE